VTATRRLRQKATVGAKNDTVTRHTEKEKKKKQIPFQEQQYNLHSNVKSEAATMLLQSKGSE